MPALAAWGIIFFASAHPCSAGCITRLPGYTSVCIAHAGDTASQAVALTFDACETVTQSYFDETILACLLGERIPFTRS
jgi:hypothetical protein